MSFLLELTVDGLTEEQGRVVERVCRERDAWPVHFAPRRGDSLPQGFTLRATWVGSEVREERDLDADELASIVLASGLNEFTLYRVPARSSSEAQR